MRREVDEMVDRLEAARRAVRAERTMAAKNDELANLHGGDFEALAHDLRRFQGIEKASAVVRDPTRWLH